MLQGQYSEQYDGGYGMRSDFNDGGAYSGDAVAGFQRDDGAEEDSRQLSAAGGDGGGSQWQAGAQSQQDLQPAYSEGGVRSWPLDQPPKDDEGFNNDFNNDWQR